MISIANLVQNNISSSNSSSGCTSSNSQGCQQAINNNVESYTIKGLNCIFMTSIHSSSDRQISPYIVIKLNGSYIFSSVCKVLSNSAFWNDCLSFRVDLDQPEKLMTVEIHNYTLYQTEKDLQDPCFDEKDLLGSGIIDLTDILSLRQQLKNYNNGNSGITVINHPNLEGRTSQLTNTTNSIASSGLSSSSHNNQNALNTSSSVYIGQTKIINNDGILVGTLQFNIQKEQLLPQQQQQYSNSNFSNNNINMANSNTTTATTISTLQQYSLEDNYKSLNTKQIEKNGQHLQQSLSLTTYCQPKSTTTLNTYGRKEVLTPANEEREYRSNNNTIHTPYTASNSNNQTQFFNNGSASYSNSYSIPHTPYIIQNLKSAISENDVQSTSINQGQLTNPNLESSLTARYQFYNLMKLTEEDSNIQTNQIGEYHQNITSNNNNTINGIASSSCQEEYEQYDDQNSYFSNENVYNQQVNNPQIQKQVSQLQYTQNIMNSEQYQNTTVSPLRDIQGKSCLSISQQAKPYVGFQSQFGQPVQYPQFYPHVQQQPQQQQQIQQQQQVGYINLTSAGYQQYNNTNNTAPTISTCSQRNSNQVNQIALQNFTQAVQVLGQNSMNVLPNQGQQIQVQNNLIRTVQSQKTIVNKFPSNNCSNNTTNTLIPQAAIFQYQNNSIGQVVNQVNSAATPGSIQKVNVGVATQRQPFSAAATPFKNQRNAQNFYQPF